MNLGEIKNICFHRCPDYLGCAGWNNLVESLFKISCLVAYLCRPLQNRRVSDCTLILSIWKLKCVVLLERCMIQTFIVA
jgi:hypothetical protein